MRQFIFSSALNLVIASSRKRHAVPLHATVRTSEVESLRFNYFATNIVPRAWGASGLAATTR